MALQQHIEELLSPRSYSQNEDQRQAQHQEWLALLDQWEQDQIS
jgi:hypothetical protein